MPAITATLAWQPCPLTDLEWHRLHARRPLPLGALPVWLGLAAYGATLSYSWTSLPSLAPGLAAQLSHFPIARLLLSPMFWMQALVFWLLPWMLLERRMRYRGNSLPELEAKTAALIRLYGYALAFYPLLRLGTFGVLHLFRHGQPAPNFIDAILFDLSQPMILRYFAALGFSALFGITMWCMVVSRLRLAQWAAMSTPGRWDRFVAYAISTGIFALFLGVLKRSCFDYFTDPAAALAQGKMALFLTNLLPWALISILVATAIAAGAHRAARQRVGLF